MRLLPTFLLMASLQIPVAVFAQNIVVSDAVNTTSMTVYRDPNRGDQPMNKNWPGGYALITETRTIAIPAGESVIRFEGVSEGMFPESAIVSGLPKGIREKNRDARLLSPAGLVDAYLKRQVTLTRTNEATGKSRQQTAMVTAGPDGGVVFETDDGFEALRCTGLPDRMKFGGLPAGLSAKPTLSVIAQADRAVKVTVTLTYMAGGFDWQANYILDTKPFQGNHELDVDVFAWMTIANGGNQSFANANVMAVAGRPNRIGNAVLPQGRRPELVLTCWPMQRTHQVPFRLPYVVADLSQYDFAKKEKIAMRGMLAAPMAVFAPPPPPPSPTAAIVAQQEDIGDLKLYRIPERVTVNAKGQKQVAMILKPKVNFSRVYRGQPVYQGYHQPTIFLQPTLIGKNETEKGLGLPLPSGQASLFENGNLGRHYFANIPVADRAIGDKIEWPMPGSTAVRVTSTIVSRDKAWSIYKMVVGNSWAFAVGAEITLPSETVNLPDSVKKVDGRPTWFVQVPANDTVEMTIKVKQR